jgi:uncharacterized protein (DUF885 family)
MSSLSRARLSAFPRAIDANTEMQRADAARGVFAPDYVLDRTLEVMKGVRDQPAARSALVAGLARRGPSRRLSGDHERLRRGSSRRASYPALDRQRDLVADSPPPLHPRRRACGGSRTRGLLCGALEASTTTKLGAEEIHQLGLAQVRELEAELDPILRGAGLTRATAGERLAELTSAPTSFLSEHGRRPVELMPSSTARSPR